MSEHALSIGRLAYGVWRDNLLRECDFFRNSGLGCTFGIHSRILGAEVVWMMS